MIVIPPYRGNNQARSLWVMSALRLSGQSFASIGREHGWSGTVVRNAMHMPLDAQERAIAEALGVTQQELFPERYDAHGNRLHHVRKNRRASTESHVKNTEAA